VKLSCVPASWFMELAEGRMPIEAWIDFGAALGLDAVDFGQAWFRDRRPPVLAALRARLASRGLRAGMIRGAPDFTHPDPRARRATLDEMRALLEVAHALGAPLLRVTAGQAHPGVARADGVAWACEGLTALVPAARAAGVTLAYENHTKASVWAYRDFSEDSAVFLDIVRATEGSGLGVNFDTGNPLVHGEDPLPLLRQVAHRLACVDANDSRTRGRFEFCVVGQGLVPFAELFGFLKRGVGYDGWISVEEFSRTGEQGFRDAVRFVRDAWAAA
jgi:sugar phosphate isomerase/epimerase